MPWGTLQLPFSTGRGRLGPQGGETGTPESCGQDRAGPRPLSPKILETAPESQNSCPGATPRWGPLGSLFPWQPSSVCSDGAPGGCPLLGIRQGPQEDHPSQVKAGAWPSLTPALSLRACSCGCQSQTVPCCPGPPWQLELGDPVTGTEDASPALGSSHVLKPGPQTADPSGRKACGRQETQARPHPGSHRHSLGLGVGAVEGALKGTRGFVFHVPAQNHSGGGGPESPWHISAPSAPESSPAGWHHCPHGTDEALETQKGKATCPRPHS